MASEGSAEASRQWIEQLAALPMSARRLLCLIARQARRGLLRSKAPGTATMPEIHETCGLDVEALYELLNVLKSAGWVTIEGQYPFEELMLAQPPALQGAMLRRILDCCERSSVPLETVLVDLDFGCITEFPRTEQPIY